MVLDEIAVRNTVACLQLRHPERRWYPSDQAVLGIPAASVWLKQFCLSNLLYVIVVLYCFRCAMRGSQKLMSHLLSMRIHGTSPLALELK